MSEEIQEKNENNVLAFSKFSQVLNEFLENTPEKAENIVVDVRNEFIAFTVPRKKKPI